MQAIANAEDESARKKVEAESLRKLIEKLSKECKKTEEDKQKAETELEAIMTASSVSQSQHTLAPQSLNLSLSCSQDQVD